MTSALRATTEHIEALCARVYTGSEAAAAHYLGIPRKTLKHRLLALRRALHASSTAHLAAMLWPLLRDYMPIRHTAPLPWLKAPKRRRWVRG